MNPCELLNGFMRNHHKGGTYESLILERCYESYLCLFIPRLPHYEDSRMKPKGRPLEVGGAREVLSPGAIYVRGQVKTSLEAWRRAYGLPFGRAIDALFDHAMRSEGAFLFKLPLDGARPSLKGPILPESESLPSNEDKTPKNAQDGVSEAS